MVIRVLIADDQALVRGALAALLNLEPDIEVVSEVDDGDGVLAAVREHDVDVCLLDIQMTRMDGIAATAQVRQAVPEVRVLIVTTFGRTGYLRRALEAGASGFVVKDTPAQQLADAIRRVHQGLRVVDQHLAAESLSEGSNPLSEREREILALAHDGVQVAVIAKHVHLSPGTVRNHLSSAIGKTGARNRIEAAHRAAERGWL